MVVSATRREFSVSYEGEALNDGIIPVDILAPSLVAFGQLFQEANSALYPSSPPVVLEVRAFGRSSFHVVMDLAHTLQGFHQQLLNFLTAPDAVATSTLVTIIAPASGLLDFIRARFRHGEPRDQISADDKIIITFADGTTLVFPRQVLELSRNLSIRRHAHAFVRPLQREGIDRIVIQVPNYETLTIQSDDVEAYDVADALIDEQFAEDTLGIVGCWFVQGHKWRLSDGTQTYAAEIVDPGFWSRFERGDMRFGIGDALRCVLRTQVWVREEGPRTEFAVVLVLEHIPANEPEARQLRFREDEGLDAASV